MFPTSYVHHKEDCIVHVALYDMFHEKIKIRYLISQKVQYSLSDDEHKKFETWRRQEKLI